MERVNGHRAWGMEHGVKDKKAREARKGKTTEDREQKTAGS